MTVISENMTSRMVSSRGMWSAIPRLKNVVVFLVTVPVFAASVDMVTTVMNIGYRPFVFDRIPVTQLSRSMATKMSTFMDVRATVWMVALFSERDVVRSSMALSALGSVMVLVVSSGMVWCLAIRLVKVVSPMGRVLGATPVIIARWRKVILLSSECPWMNLCLTTGTKVSLLLNFTRLIILVLVSSDLVCVGVVVVGELDVDWALLVLGGTATVLVGSVGL